MYKPTINTKITNDSKERDEGLDFVLNMILEELKKIRVHLSLMSDHEITNKDF